jgi:lipopolysaccharide transport system ATP-binding protein
LTEDTPGLMKRGLSFGPIVVNGESPQETPNSEPITVSTTLHIPEPVAGFTLFCLLEDAHGRNIFHLREESTALGFQSDVVGEFAVVLPLPPLWLNPGLYSIFFKVILWGEYGNARSVSDKQPLDFVGSCSAVECVLHPSTIWRVCSMNSAVCQQL